MISVIILAAGAASRMGKPKQLLVYRGKTLLQHTIDKAGSITKNSIYVVVGARSKQIISSVDGDRINWVFNPKWELGMSSSIQAGLKKVMELEKNLNGVIILLVDQPLITIEHLQNLVDRFEETQAPIVASEYNGKTGVPALFSSLLFNELLVLEGQGGARYLIRSYEKQLERISFPEGQLDLDTPEDWASFLARNNT